jgi:quercetin 2,3-dioxygenase
MSGPVTDQDVPLDAGCGEPEPPEVELVPVREAVVGGTAVRRALPRRQRRTVAAWCFADHFGPDGPPGSMQVGPHPHTGLHTVTWLVDGEVLHRDSLGSEQLIRPGQLNLMTAGHGVAHSEETRPEFAGVLHGVQLWVAQPASTRHGGAAFEHHADLPRLPFGPAVVTVLVGGVGDGASPARADSPLVGAEILTSGGTTEIPLVPDFEHALLVVDGLVSVAGVDVTPGALAYLGEGRGELVLASPGPARVLLLGGEPMREKIVMGWNFVGRSRDEVVQAGRDWNAGHDRFGTVDSPLERIPAPVP